MALAALYLYRHSIIKHYAEKILRENLPEYIKIDGIKFDFGKNKVDVLNFRILNPPDFSSDFFLNIKEISARYAILGKGIPSGIEISNVRFSGADVRIERLSDGRINAVEMERFINSFPPRTPQRPTPNAQLPSAPSQSQTFKEAADIINKKISDLIKLPKDFDLNGSKLIFIDRVPYENPYVITIQSIYGRISINFADDYSKITELSFTLTGRLNGLKNEVMKWTAHLNPATPKITMSNRFNVSGLNLLTFEPYYDSFSPFVFKRGIFSGTLVFDFNNGDIGSMNEVHLSDLKFYVKPGYENSEIWGTTVPDLLKYFTTPTGEVVFDFKLKGDMANPTPYLGPISKRALTSMAIEKAASFALDQVSGKKEGSGDDLGGAKEAIDIFKQLLRKK